MKQAEDRPRWFFVDEAGDPAFYGPGKKIIVGDEGCSKTFSVGFFRTFDPEQIRSKLAEVRLAISQDLYLKDIPSLKDSLVAFHAKNDCPEVRKLVFEALAKMDFGAQIVVARKIEKIFCKAHLGSQDRFYDFLVSKLFHCQLHLSTHNTIVFSRRGSKARQRSLKKAIQTGVDRFHRQNKGACRTTIIVETSQPVQEHVLQAADYVMWAVQRSFERGEMRYFEFLRDKIEVVWDIYDIEKIKAKQANLYDRKKNAFDIKKASPLKLSPTEGATA
jgi:hypothetical protein